MKGEPINNLLTSGTDFGNVVKQLLSEYDFTQFVEDDPSDEFQPLVSVLQDSEICEEVWSKDDFTLYREDQVYRLCLADPGSSYSIYLW